MFVLRALVDKSAMDCACAPSRDHAASLLLMMFINNRYASEVS